MKYLHSKFIVHRDLHAKNVLLKYNPDSSKTCMICDFGACKVLNEDHCDDHEFHEDVHDINQLIHLMLGFPASPVPDLSEDGRALVASGQQVLIQGRMTTLEPNTIREFVHKFAWFRGPVVAPIIRAPSPLPIAGRTLSRSRSPSHESPVRAVRAASTSEPVTPGDQTPRRRSLGSRVRRSIGSISRALVRPFRRLNVVRRGQSRGAGSQEPASRQDTH